MTTKKRICVEYCSVYGCLNKTNNELSFHRVPKEIELRREWLKAIGRDEQADKHKRLLVCSIHFDNSTFKITRRLEKNAVPTKSLPYSCDDIVQSDDRNIIITSTQNRPHSSKVLSSRISKKKKKQIFKISHAQCQTEHQDNEVAFNNEKEDEIEKAPELVKHNTLTQKATEPLKQKSVQPPIKYATIQASQPQEKPNIASASTQTEFKTSQHKGTQTLEAVSDNISRKRMLKKDINLEHFKRRRLETEVLKIQKELEGKTLLSDSEDKVAQRFMKLVEWQNKVKDKFKGNRCDAEYKVFAQNLYYASPHAYRFFKTILKLPSKSALNRLKLKIPPKLDDRVLKSLALKINSLPANAKYCTICVGVMVLKRSLFYDISRDEVVGFHNINGSVSHEIAKNAYVIMLQGIYCSWQQPIAYAFHGSTKHYADLDSWMNEVILKLFGIGIEVKAVISDQTSNFDKYAKVIKGVTIEKPYFFVDDHKIFYIFDVPHLLKCVRNNLLSDDFQYQEDKISWDYIDNLFEHQKDKNLRLIPKLTIAHIDPNNFQRMKVKYAAQVFSNTVCAALETYIDFGLLPEEARGTAKFIKIMDDLFDVLNSSKLKYDKKNKSAFKLSTEQKNILLHAQYMFGNIKATNQRTGKDITKQIRTFHNFRITIQSILELFEDLQLDGFKYLFTKRLNQESVERFFSLIKLEVGPCTEPTPIQFMRAFSKLFHVNMLKSDKTNCNSDLYEILLKYEDIIDNSSANTLDDVRTSLPTLDGDTDYRIHLPEANALTYVAGFLLYKCSKKHTNCKELLRTIDSSALDINKFCNCKAYNKKERFYGSLKVPSKEMIEYVKKLETTFANNFEHHIQGNPGSEILELLKGIPTPTLPCQCFPVEYMLRLFVRLRIYSTIKFNNRNLKSEKESIKQYLKVKQM